MRARDCVRGSSRGKTNLPPSACFGFPFDAATAIRQWVRTISHEKATPIIRRGQRTHSCPPTLVRSFCSVHPWMCVVRHTANKMDHENGTSPPRTTEFKHATWAELVLGLNLHVYAQTIADSIFDTTPKR